jgi:hypothetical protein
VAALRRRVRGPRRGDLSRRTGRVRGVSGGRGHGWRRGGLRRRARRPRNRDRSWRKSRVRGPSPGRRKRRWHQGTLRRRTGFACHGGGLRRRRLGSPHPVRQRRRLRGPVHGATSLLRRYQRCHRGKLVLRHRNRWRQSRGGHIRTQRDHRQHRRSRHGQRGRAQRAPWTQPSHPLEPTRRLLLKRRQELRLGRRIAQQIAQCLLARHGVEQFLILQRRREQRLPLFRGQRAGGVSAHESVNLFPAHRFSQSPPINSSRFLRQRWSHV